ncbi:cupin domain-containing protein [Corallococcus sp. 4LFB]|uniref:cupin domain-containing protein n=1 Tax=Corallococcus sp. 4LFB TaxID=3383249 RepID=UPI0039758A13
MGDTSVKKVESRHSPKGEMGQKYLASGVRVAMRLWEDEPPAEAKPASTRDYETVGFVLKGRAELHLEGQVLVLNPGDSWLVPRGASHTYKILETFSAVEATSPIATAHGRDEHEAPKGAKA